MESEDRLLPTPKSAFIILIITFLLLLPLGLKLFLLLGKTRLLLGEVMIMIPAATYVCLKKLPFRLVFRLKGVRWEAALASLLIGISATVLIDELDRLIQLIFPMPEEIYETLTSTLKIHSLEDWIIILSSSIILAGFLEEMFFRGFLQGALERAGDVTRAVVITAIVFATLHLNPWWIIQITFLGLLLGIMTWRSGSILPAALVHGINNGMAVYFANVDDSKIGWYLWGEHVSPVILLLMGGLIVVGFRLFYRHSQR